MRLCVNVYISFSKEQIIHSGGNGKLEVLAFLACISHSLAKCLAQPPLRALSFSSFPHTQLLPHE